MLHVEVNVARTVYLIRFKHILTEDDIARLDAVANVLVEAEGSFDTIFDFTDVTGHEISREYAAWRGAVPQKSADTQRVFVSPVGEFRSRLQAYAADQSRNGLRPPLVVATLEEAFAALACPPTGFRPIDTDWLKQFEAT